MTSEGKRNVSAEESLRVANAEPPAVDAPAVEAVPAAAKGKAHITPDVVNDWLRELLRWGTPACAAFCGLCGVVLAILLLTAGFWKTLFITLLCVIGVFVGGVKEKTQWVKDTINRLFPPKNEN